MDAQKHEEAVIDLGPEVVVDRSRIRDPYVRLLLAVVGEPVATGSPWVAVNKGVAVLCLATAVRTRPERRPRRRQERRQESGDPQSAPVGSRR